MGLTIMPNNRLNVLITGSNGQLGSELKAVSKNYNYCFFFSTKEDLNITNEDLLKKYLIQNNIQVIINCAAYTAVDKAEAEQRLADEINYIAVRNIALASKELNIKLIHISTDYVFNGKNYLPYLENDCTGPQSVYGESKLKGEESLVQINPKYSIIIRTSWVYSTFGNNFVKTMVRLGKENKVLGVVCDQIGTPTYARDLAIVILDIIPMLKNNNIELYHYSNEGVASWYDFAKNIMEIANLDCEVNPIQTFEYPTPAHRPYYSVLNKIKIKSSFDINIPYWKDSLKHCLTLLGY